MRAFDDYFSAESSEPYQSPPYVPPVQWQLAPEQARETPPYVPPFPYGSQLDTGTEYRGVSTTGPTISVQPLAAMRPGIPAGSLLAGIRYSFGSYGPTYRRGAQYIPSQRGFSVEHQEGLRRRKGRGLPRSEPNGFSWVCAGVGAVRCEDCRSGVLLRSQCARGVAATAARLPSFRRIGFR